VEFALTIENGRVATRQSRIGTRPVRRTILAERPPKMMLRIGRLPVLFLMALRGVHMKRKGLRVIRRGTVLEGELPESLRKHGPKWLKTWPKVKLIRTRSKEKPDG
jgi:hypothetical protein